MTATTAKLCTFVQSSIARKVIVALTGIALLIFLLGHMIGNLLIYLGPDAINTYAATLHSMPAFLWAVRLGLLAVFVIHIVVTILLARENLAARTSRYAFNTTVRASKASRTMVISGLIVLAFLIYHILHYTVAVTNPEFADLHDAEGRHHVYNMVVTGFLNPFVSGFYILSIALLCLHISHGFSSVFQTLGLRTDKLWPLINILGGAYAILIFVGTCSIPIAVLTGLVPLDVVDGAPQEQAAAIHASQ